MKLSGKAEVSYDAVNSVSLIRFPNLRILGGELFFLNGASSDQSMKQSTWFVFLTQILFILEHQKMFVKIVFV